MQEELLNGRPNSRIFILDADDSRNPAKRKLQFFSVYSPIRIGGVLPVTLHNGIWHQLTKEFRLANAAPGIHDYDEQSTAGKEKAKSLPDTEDNIDESLQKAINQSIRESPIVPNMILPPRHGLLLDIPTMSTTTAPTETVAFTTTASAKEEQIAKALGKAMKKYPSPQKGGGPPGGGGPSRGRGPPGGGGGSPGGAVAPPTPVQPPAANQDV